MSGGRDLGSLVEAVTVVAATAARRILDIYETDFEVHRKVDETPVTAADLAAQEVIVDALARITPGVPVISEEARAPDLARRRGWSELWLVDPLDGTRGFVGRDGEFAVNIALVEAGRPILGVVWLPAWQTCYRAVRGSGATKREMGASPRPIRTRPMRAGELTVVTSKSRRNPLVAELIDRCRPREVLRVGSAYKSCLVAEGRADVYPGFSPTSEWDTAAAQCIVEEAGGVLVDLDLAPLRYNRGHTLGNPRFLALGDPRADWERMLGEVLAASDHAAGPGPSC
ncbi:MAG: 3'(2'),5'-bisphosphate nucleotidase CysQ [Ectothiorhodospiraceae bacterium]|nr:3'(2'),5'-bisphosphate nucleotidase CysQ [Chromatiales bacterium]MCP5156457.1 3'(2'),5'-bisphosphate nucleotidase CysQ [Ectothiorhodospiraceae bacterium]